MTTNNLITFAEALWQSGIVPALLIFLFGLLIAHFDGNKDITTLLSIAERAVEWAQQEFDGGETQKAHAISMVSKELLKLDKAHLFTSKQIDEAIEWAVLQMKGRQNE